MGSLLQRILALCGRRCKWDITCCAEFWRRTACLSRTRCWANQVLVWRLPLKLLILLLMTVRRYMCVHGILVVERQDLWLVKRLTAVTHNSGGSKQAWLIWWKNGLILL